MKRLLGNSASDEAQAQGILLDRLERAFARRISAELTSASNAMVDEFERTGADPSIPLAHMQRIEQLYADMAGVTIQAFGGRIFDAAEKVGRLSRSDDGKSFTVGLETKSFAEFFQRFAAEFIQGEAIRRRITSVSDYTRTRIINAISKGRAEGVGSAEIARDIRAAIPTVSHIRAETIARTETHDAANYGADQAARSTGLKLMKEWVSVEDHRTRGFDEANGQIDEYDHRSMNGQIVPMDQPFSMPWIKGDPLKIMYPGEAGMPAAAVIRCRCAVAHIVPDIDD